MMKRPPHRPDSSMITLPFPDHQHCCHHSAGNTLRLLEGGGCGHRIQNGRVECVVRPEFFLNDASYIVRTPPLYLNPRHVW